MIFLASGSTPAISPIPFALSTIGPKASIEMLFPVRVSMPIPDKAIPYITNTTEEPEKKKTEAIIAKQIINKFHTVASKLIDNPSNISVADPALDERASSSTLFLFGFVK